MYSLPIFLNVPNLESISHDVIAFPTLTTVLVAFLIAALVTSILGLWREHSSNVALPSRNEKVIDLNTAHRSADAAHKAAA